MHLILFFISILVLFPFPILYPPIASFAAFFFSKGNQLDLVALFLLYSSAVVTSLIAATITPVSDTAVYLDSFDSISFFDFRTLTFDNNGFEPLYKIYEFILNVLIGDRPEIFLLVTALIINLLVTTAILRIGIRVNQYKMPCLILAVCYSLVAPALGVPLFLLRSSLSLAILLLAISFYGERPFHFYLLSVLSIFTHYSSLIIFGLIVLYSYWKLIGKDISELLRKSFYFSVRGTFISKICLLALLVGLIVTFVSPEVTTPFLISLLSDFGNSGNVAADKAKSFLSSGAENFVDFKNPVVIIQLCVTLLCFLKLRNISELAAGSTSSKVIKKIEFLGALRLVGRCLLGLIIITAPLNALPFRLGFFNFMYFPLWLINIPYIELSRKVKNYSAYLVLFSMAAVLAYTFYWIPKRETGEYLIVVLENKPLKYNLIEVLGYFN